MIIKKKDHKNLNNMQQKGSYGFWKKKFPNTKFICVTIYIFEGLPKLPQEKCSM
jgi:hypothetical protein